MVSVLLLKIISHNRTYFVKGKAISDTILLTQELVQDVDYKITSDNTICKLDITKAYDNIGCDLLFNIHALFGFSN